MGRQDDNERSGIGNLGVGRLPSIQTLGLFRTAGREGDFDQRRVPRESGTCLGAKAGVMLYDIGWRERPLSNWYRSITVQTAMFCKEVGA